MADVQTSLRTGGDAVSPGKMSGGTKPSSPDTITIPRSTLQYAVFSLDLVIAAYFAGWIIGRSSGEMTAVMRTAVQEAATTSIAITAQSQPVPTTSLRRLNMTIDNNPTIGPDNAPVTIIEFADFQCPLCKRFHDQVLPALLKQYEVKIRFVYRNFPIRAIHGSAQSAAEAAQCARDQGKFWEYHDLLFQDTQRLSSADLLTYAGQISLDKEAFQDCLESGRDAQNVQRDYQAGIAIGVSGTPTFFINGWMLVGAQPRPNSRQ